MPVDLHAFNKCVPLTSSNGLRTSRLNVWRGMPCQSDVRNGTVEDSLRNDDLFFLCIAWHWNSSHYAQCF